MSKKLKILVLIIIPVYALFMYKLVISLDHDDNEEDSTPICTKNFCNVR